MVLGSEDIGLIRPVSAAAFIAEPRLAVYLETQAAVSHPTPGRPGGGGLDWIGLDLGCPLKEVGIGASDRHQRNHPSFANFKTEPRVAVCLA